MSWARVLLTLLAFCSTAQAASGDVSVEVHGLAPIEATEFETRMVPRMRSFLKFWERRGLKGAQPQSRLRVYVQPAPWQTKAKAIESLYGFEGAEALTQLMERIGRMQSAAEIHRQLKTFTCRFPPLFHGIAERSPGPADDNKVDAYKLEIRREYERIIDPARPIPGFETDNGFYLEGAGGCSVILLGRSSDPGLRPHPFLSEDVLLHEVGHSMIERAVPQGRVITKAFQETMADLLAHTFLDENCHGVHIVPSTGATTCRRDMNRGGPPLANQLWRNEPHRAGDSVRKLLWTSYLASGQDRFAHSFGLALGTVLKNRPLPKVREIPRDPFLRIRSELRMDYQLHAAVVRDVCARLGAPAAESCEETQKVLGMMSLDALQRLIQNSPTRVGVSGRRVTVDGADYRVSFSQGFSPLRMELTPPAGGGPRSLVCSGSGLFAPEKIAYLSCVGPGGGEVNWTSYGALRLN